MKTRQEWIEEAMEWKGYTYEEILAACQDIEKDIVAGYEEGLYAESTAEEYAKRLYEEVEK